ncbi:tetratricopeptide repeat protein [Brevibacillus massiliensis]|uniref:tetratricopeptide repeat protein n=1 Tax=Brevibacillus massiliensis TaxID=1118054 RepID=UPI0003090D1E|nr:tetratricopeptide repeat protein [Brevibacillus massiliensis]
MSISQWFDSLNARLQTVEREWPAADEPKRMALAKQLFELREASDQFVELWLHFEEQLSRVIKEIKEQQGQPVQTDDKAFQAVKQAVLGDSDSGQGSGQPAGNQEKTAALEDDARTEQGLLFRKGEGFYHLRLFHDAKRCFSELVQHSPDWEYGRLYYAYSLFFSEEREAATKEFRLLSRTASSPKITAISFNALGCIFAEEARFLEANQAFTAALEAYPHYLEALFNLALCQLHDGAAEEALDSIEQYLQRSEDDWEAQIVWLRAAEALAAMDGMKERVPPVPMRMPNRHLKPNTLRELAAVYEARGQVHRAQVCYRYLTEQLPGEGWTWHGLAWTLWQINGTEKAFSLVKKAISLAPDNLDFHFSYGWMQLFSGQQEDALKTFRFILSRQRDHRLAQSGLITVCSAQGDYVEAKRVAESFLLEDDAYLRSLGYYHLGRLAMLQEDWLLAREYFRHVDGNHGFIREVPLFLKLCAEKLGLDSRQLTEESLPI